MWKTSTIAMCALALSGSFATAQTYNNQSPGWAPPATGNPPAGAGGPTSASQVGNPSANVNQTVNGQTRSTSMLSQSNKAQSAAGMSSSNYGQPAGGQSAGAQGPYANGAQGQMQYGGPQAQMQQASCGSNGAATITDEYGHRYNCRGDRLRR